MSTRLCARQLDGVRRKFADAQQRNGAAAAADALPRRELLVEHELRDLLVAAGDAKVRGPNPDRSPLA
jgi:hypothetical protein